MAKPYNKTVVSITGAAAQNLLTVMQANGYAASSSFECSLNGTELTLGSPGGQSLFIGSSSDVTDAGATKGFELPSSSFDTQRATGQHGNNIDPSQIWLYLATTDDVSIRYRSV